MQDIINTHLLRKDESLVSNFLFNNFIFILIILKIMLAIDIHSKRTLGTTIFTQKQQTTIWPMNPKTAKGNALFLQFKH